MNVRRATISDKYHVWGRFFFLLAFWVAFFLMTNGLLDIIAEAQDTVAPADLNCSYVYDNVMNDSIAIEGNRDDRILTIFYLENCLGGDNYGR